MASTTALFTGLSGLATNSRRLDVIGNNIANVNTTGFKASRMMFAPTFSRTLSGGTGPSEATGGANPSQVGLGVIMSGTQRIFTNGSISATGVPTDLAIEGDGFFAVRAGVERMFTRVGAFQLNARNDLVTINGANVLGYGVDDSFQVVEGNLIDLNIPVGTMTVAESTRNVTFSGNLNASGAVATTGSIHTTRAFYTDAGLTTLLGSANYDLTVPGNDLYIDDGAGGSFLALEGGAGTIITLSGIEKDGKEMRTASFAFSNSAVAGTEAFGATLQDFMGFMEDVFGLSSANVSGQTLGGGISFSNGQIVITGNEGTAQELNIDTANLAATNAGSGISQPFVMSQTGSADGESVRTSFIVYDSLGTPLTVDLTFVLQDTTAGEGTTWQFIAESSDNDALSRVIGLGVVEFDANGRLISSTNDAFSVVRDNGAVTPLTVSMVFDSGTDAITALTHNTSTMAAVFQDGSALGRLTSFTISDDGIISGAFTNGLFRTIGQIALAKFANPEGLVDIGNGMFTAGPNSGEALITTPLEFESGRLVQGALELSNVDLSQEFINMILASTGYSAASRVITTTDELMQQLLAIGA